MDLASNYKKKGMALSDSDKRILRVKRRSVDQKLQRDETFMKKRNIGPLTPLRESTIENTPETGTRRPVTMVTRHADKSTTAAQNKSTVRKETAETLARREMLQKWKKEKELKKKLESEKQKHRPQFKVFKVQQEKRPTTCNYGTANSTVVSRSRVLKPVPEPQRRVTRSTAKTSTSKPVTSQCKPTGPVNSAVNKRTTRQSSRIVSKTQDHKENLPATRQQVKNLSKSSNKPQADSHKSKPKALILTKPHPQPLPKPDPQPETNPDSEPEVVNYVNLPSPSSTCNVKSERGGAAIPSCELQKSFAPAHFSFNFQFEPLSPASTQSFLFPGTEFRKGRCSTPMTASCRKRDASPVPLEFSVIQSPKRALNHSPPRQESKQDVSYFRNLLTAETAKLNDLCIKWDVINEETVLSEEVSGEIRCTSGKAQLLIKQRFKQFSGLVDNCELGLGEKKTHPSDLVGFWDMVYFQIEDVMAMFAALDKLQANNWSREEAEPEPAKKKTVKKPKPPTKAQQSDKDRTAAKKRLEAVKAAMKARQTRSKAADHNVFEGGFFKVESPVHSPTKHCHAGSAFKLVQTNAPSHGNGGTPRIQAYTPKDARRSIQLGKLCGPLSKLVLGEVATPKNKGATPKHKMATPTRKADTPLNSATLNMSDENLEQVTVVFRTPESSNEKSLFARYLQPSVPPVVNLNEQAENLGFGSQHFTFDQDVTSEAVSLEAGPAQKEELQGHKTDIVIGESSQAEPVLTNHRPRTRSRCKSGVLLAGLGSPILPRTPAGANKTYLSDVFTPPAFTAVSQMSDDLICFDSPLKSSVPAPPIPLSDHKSSGLPTPRDDVKIPSIRRRSTRLRHHSAFSTLPTDDSSNDSEMPTCPNKPNLSVM